MADNAAETWNFFLTNSCHPWYFGGSYTGTGTVIGSGPVVAGWAGNDEYFMGCSLFEV